MNSRLTNNVLLFFITKYYFKAAVWYLNQSYLHYIHWDSKVTVNVNEMKTGSKLKTSGRRFLICVVVAFKFPFRFLSLSKSWTRRLAFSIESPLLIYPGSSLGSCLTETDQQIDRHTNQTCFVSSTTSGHKSCICNTIDSCRLFLHRVSPRRYFCHRQNMAWSEKSEQTCGLLLKLQSDKPVDSLC